MGCGLGCRLEKILGLIHGGFRHGVWVGLCCHEVGVVVRCGWGSVEKRKKKLLFYNILIGCIVK